MSTCISREGEYGDHQCEPGNFICDRCGVLDEEGMFAELDRLREERVRHIGDDSVRSMELKSATKRAESAEAEVARLTQLLEQRTAALTRTIDAKNTAEAQIARMRAAVNLLDDGDITPTGRRMLNAALDGGRSSDAATWTAPQEDDRD